MAENANEKKMRREKLVQLLERGRESATQIRRLLFDHHDYGQIDAHSLEVLASFSTALSMLQDLALLFDDYHDHQGLKRPNPTSPPPHHHHHLKSDQEFDDWEAPKTPKDGRGCYKRRKTEQSVGIESSNTDDGYAWRKYGQKAIQHTKHPRNYYRCTHKTDQGCQATKQVQQITENPPKFNIIYNGHHTCKNPLKTPPMYLDLLDDHDQHNPSFFLSFETSKSPKQGLIPFMFPSSSSSSSSTPSSSTGSPISNAIMVEQEYVGRLIKDEIPSEPLDHHHEPDIQCPSSPDFLSTTSDLTTTTHVSDDLMISLAEVYSSVVIPHGVEEDYSYMMAESIDFSDVFQDYDLLCV